MSVPLTTTPRADGFWMPAEWEPPHGTWLIWPERSDDWRNGAKPVQEAFARVAEVVAAAEPVSVCVSAGQYVNARERLSDKVRLVEMTTKAGQKCTAIRRVLVSAAEADAVTEALAARLKSTKVGDPRDEATRMGPLVTRGQQAAVFDGIRRLAAEAAFVCGGTDAPPLAGVSPTLAT